MNRIRIASAVLGGIAGGIVAYLVAGKHKSEAVVYKVDPDGFVFPDTVEPERKKRLHVISPEQYSNGDYAKKLVATYFPQDEILAGFDENLEEIDQDASGLHAIVAELVKTDAKAIYAADPSTGTAYEILEGTSTYEEALADAMENSREELAEKADELGYSEDEFDSVVASIGD